MNGDSTSTRQKALALNLDATRYGTFAEIGGGQEVARWFFSVGGAAGTIAETISAYDMAQAVFWAAGSRGIIAAQGVSLARAKRSDKAVSFTRRQAGRYATLFEETKFLRAANC